MCRRMPSGMQWLLADLAQLVEQLFCKQQVVGSNPTVGSTRHNASINALACADPLHESAPAYALMPLSKIFQENFCHNPTNQLVIQEILCHKTTSSTWNAPSARISITRRPRTRRTPQSALRLASTANMIAR